MIRSFDSILIVECSNDFLDLYSTREDSTKRDSTIAMFREVIVVLTDKNADSNAREYIVHPALEFSILMLTKLRRR